MFYTHINNMRPTRLLITSFYFAAMISFYIFRLIPEMLFTWTEWLLSFFANTFVADPTTLTQGSVWWCLLLVCMSITFIIRKFVVQPLGFYVNGDAVNSSELVILALLVLGFYLYSFNTLFPEYVMPASPAFLRVLLGEQDNSLTVIDSNTWSIVPWIWYAGPVLFMYSIFLRTEFSYARVGRDIDGDGKPD